MADPLDSISRWRRVDADALAGLALLDPVVGLRVALHGDVASLHDAIAGRPGDFDRLVAGLAELRMRASPPAIACEIMVVADNLEALPRIIARAGSLGARGCVVAIPEAPTPTMAPLEDVVPAALRAIAQCRQSGLQGVLRGLPACLLGADAAALAGADAVADPPRFACLFAGTCELAERCAGLPIAYIHRFGWEARRLRPRPRASAWPRPLPAPAYPEWRALLGPGARWVRSVVLDRLAARFTLELGGGRSLVIELTPRDASAPAFARSRSFDVRYTRADGLAPHEVARVVAPIAASIVARDDGALDLDPRRGLPPLPPR